MQNSVIMLMRAAFPLFGMPITVLARIQQHRVLQTTALPSLRIWFESRVHHSESWKAYSTDVSWASGKRTWCKVGTWAVHEPALVRRMDCEGNIVLVCRHRSDSRDEPGHPILSLLV